ncbi:MAG: tetratricopeptide repeat protein [Acidobacteriota bacterium]|nr:tetratricopeptide repeat protein [Acidobacteriota bacterium]
MSHVSRLRLAGCAGLLLVSATGGAQRSATPDDGKEKFDHQFQTAAADYHAGNFAAAEQRLEELAPEVPASFEVHELLGLTYGARSEKTKAVTELELAVRLKPDSATARTNLAAALSKQGRLALAEVQFRQAVALDPADFTANHNLAEFYLQSNKILEAVPLLEEAQRVAPSSYDNGYDLALAYFLTERLNDARQLTQKLLQQNNTAEVHNLMGQVEEKEGNFIRAATEFQSAAEMEPTEDNLFAWASELLLHRAYEPSIAVFQQGIRRYPRSPRLLVGQGMALYSQSKYQDAIKSLLAAADLDPSDARCYLFLSKSYLSSPSQADEVIERFRRYSELEPHNGLAQYYYAMSLWKGRRLDASEVDSHQVESLLQKSIALDGTLADAHLQLGNLYAEEHDFAHSFPEYVQALRLNPELSDAHYRLGQYYVHVGKKDDAQKEFAIYQQLESKRLDELDKKKAQQFVYSATAGSATNH